MAKKVVKADDNGFSPKWTKILSNTNSSFMGEADSLDQDGLERIILEAEKSIEEQEKLADADESLKTAKENVKLLGSAYSDAKKYQMAKLKYCLFNLARMGK